MKTRARWRGPPPEVGDFLRTSRTLYVVTAVGKPTEAHVPYGSTTANDDQRRVTLTIERVPNALQRHPLTRRVHPFRWDPRGKRRKDPLVFG